jgi:hypothetical protein
LQLKAKKKNNTDSHALAWEAKSFLYLTAN